MSSLPSTTITSLIIVGPFLVFRIPTCRSIPYFRKDAARKQLLCMYSTPDESLKIKNGGPGLFSCAAIVQFWSIVACLRGIIQSAAGLLGPTM